MKTLLLLRHAKSSWRDSDDIQDHDRPLSSRGKRDAPRLGRLILAENLVPDYIVSSSAKRTRKTAKAVAQACHYQAEIEETGALYHAEPEEYLDVFRGLADSYNRVLVVGHNPGLEDLIEVLTNQVEVMPTCALALIELPIDNWSALKGKIRGKLIQIWRPKELPSEKESMAEQPSMGEAPAETPSEPPSPEPFSDAAPADEAKAPGE